jgi:hypothetical protein
MRLPTSKKAKTSARHQLNHRQRLRRRINRRAIAGITRLPVLLVLVAWFLVLAILALNRQTLLDWVKLRGYHPSSAVVSLASRDTFTSYARKVWYVNHPALDAKSNFRTACPNNGGEQTIVLGCYHSNQAGIYLLTVTDSRLQGVMEVTAAHEMLHAAYDRLSSADRQHVNALLVDYYQRQLTDQRVKTTIDAYRQSEPHDVVNEMHSIFGTEIANLPPELEHYYARYFTNRQHVVTLSTQYQAEFTSRQRLVAQADSQLASLKTNIEKQEADLKTRQADISRQQSQLLDLRNSGNVSAYNAGVPAYNAAIDSYNGEVASVKNLITQYNQLVATRNEVALEQDELINALNSNTTPIKQ